MYELKKPVYKKPLFWSTIILSVLSVFLVVVIYLAGIYANGIEEALKSNNRVWNETPDENIEHKVGDIWFEKNGLYQRLYIWNGEMWEKRIDTEDVSKIGEKFDAEVKKINQSMASQNQQTAQALRTSGANASAIEAAKGAITKLNQDFAGAKQTNQAAIDRLKSDFASAQKAANDQTALLRSDLTNIRTKQGQQETEIGKQVTALNATKNELAGVKSAQATFEQTTTRRLAELANVSDGKANKSELLQTAEELSSRIASVQVGSSRNYFRNSRSRSFTTNEQATYDYRLFIVSDFWQNKDRLKRDYVRLSFDVTFPVALARDVQANVHFSAHPWYAYRGLVFKGGTTERQHFEFTIDLSGAAETYQTNNVFIRFGTNYGFPAGLQVVIENAVLSIGNYYPAYQPAYEDQEERVSAVESSFKQRADSIEAGVNRLTEGLKTKADSSTLTVLSDRISASVKSLETDTQNKLDQKLSTAEFDVRASGIRQEIVNATKDKADKALVTAEAGRLREELASLQVGGRNLLRGSKGPFKPNRNPTNFDNNTLYSQDTSVYLVQNEKYRISAKTDGNFTSWHSPNNENDNVVLWLMDKAVVNYQIVSDAKTGTTGTEFIWNRPTSIYHLRVNTYRKNPEKLKSVWEVKVEQGSFKTDWSPAPEDAEGLITEAKASFERTAQGLRTDLSAVQAYVNADGTRSEALLTHSREETARQLTAERKLIEAGYVGKATYAEDVKGISRRFEELKTSSETKIAEFKQGIDGQFATISQQIAGKASQTDFQKVKETSQLYERLIGSTEKEIIDKVSRMTMTNELFQIEVSKNLGLRTVQYQMANAWAVQNLNSNGDIISQINMTGPNVRIQGESIHLDGKALIDNGIIKNAMIESMLADKITAGTLNAANVNIINLNASKIVGLDANFIKSKIELAFIEWMKGKVISAQNDAMQIDLNNGQYNVMTDQAAIRRVLNGYPNQFLKFTSETEGGAPASVTVLGANRDGTENSKNDSFAGIRLFSGNKVERTEIISDVVRFATGAVNYRGWEMRTLYGNDNRQVILQPFGNVTRSNIVANYFNGIDLVNVLETLNQMMANLGNHTGRHDIFGPIRGLGARKYAR